MQLTDEMSIIKDGETFTKEGEPKAIGVATVSITGLSKPASINQTVTQTSSQPEIAPNNTPQSNAPIQTQQDSQLENLSVNEPKPAIVSGVITGNPIADMADINSINSFIPTNNVENTDDKKPVLENPVLEEPKPIIDMPKTDTEVLAQEPKGTNEDLFNVTEQPVVNTPPENIPNTQEVKNDTAVLSEDNDKMISFDEVNLDNPIGNVSTTETEIPKNVSTTETEIPKFDDFNVNFDPSIESLNLGTQTNDMPTPPPLDGEKVNDTPFMIPQENENTLGVSTTENKEEPREEKELYRPDENEVDYQKLFEEFREKMNKLFDEYSILFDNNNKVELDNKSLDNNDPVLSEFMNPKKEESILNNEPFSVEQTPTVENVALDTLGDAIKTETGEELISGNRFYN